MLIYSLSRKIAFYFVKKGIVQQEEADVYRFGIETIICALADISIAVFVGILCGKMLYALWFFAIFAVLRQMAEGYHAKTFVRCKIMTFIMIFLVINMETFIKSGSILFVGVLLTLFLIKISKVKCSKALLAGAFVVGEIILYCCERGMAALMMLAFLIVMSATHINSEEVKV